MSRNDLIAAMVRVLGVFLLVEAILELPSFFFGLIGGMADLIQSAMKDMLLIAIKQLGITTQIAKLATLLLKIVLGYYLMSGGRWFVSKATHD